MLSCGRVKTELFENADVTTSIYYVSEHAHGSFGVTRGHFACLFSFVAVRMSKLACSSVFVWTEICSKTLLVWTRICFNTDKKDAFLKLYGYMWTGPKLKHQIHCNRQIQARLISGKAMHLGNSYLFHALRGSRFLTCSKRQSP